MAISYHTYTLSTAAKCFKYLYLFIFCLVQNIKSTLDITKDVSNMDITTIEPEGPEGIPTDIVLGDTNVI